MLLTYLSALSIIGAALPHCDATLWRGESVRAAIPLTPHASDAIEVRSTTNNQRFLHWNEKQDRESFEILSKIATCWQESGVAESFLVFGKTTPNLRSETFSWEIIPFKEGPLSVLKQLKIITSVAFGAGPLKETKRQQRALKAREEIPTLNEKRTETVSPRSKGEDPFCNQEIIDYQKVGESEHLYVLYDIRPMRLIEERPHFLIVTKEHCQDFREINETEYVEAMALTRQIVSYFKKKSKNPTLYFLHKTGRPAGQTVFHWHLHVIVEENDEALIPYQFPTSRKPENATIVQEPFRQISELYTKTIQGCKNFLTLTIPHRTLTKEEMQERVNTYREIFENE